jgi:hypothetical protein
MINKPNPAILRTSYLSNEIAKRTLKSHETIPIFFPGIRLQSQMTEGGALHMTMAHGVV